jgi:hypothetical protein
VQLAVLVGLTIILYAAAREARLRTGIAVQRSVLFLAGFIIVLIGYGLYRLDSPLTWLVAPSLVALGVFDRDSAPRPPWWALWKWRHADWQV